MKEKDVLCVIDLTPSSQDALKWAFNVAGREKANVVVLFCYHLVAAMHDEETANRKRKTEQEARSKFRKFEQDYLSGQKVSYTFLAEPGHPHFRIEMFLKHNPAGLLVLASSVVEHFDEYKNLGFSKFLKGSKIPVIVVPQCLGSESYKS